MYLKIYGEYCTENRILCSLYELSKRGVGVLEAEHGEDGGQQHGEVARQLQAQARHLLGLNLVVRGQRYELWK